MHRLFARRAVARGGFGASAPTSSRTRRLIVAHADVSAVSEKPWNDIVVDARGNAYVNTIGFDFPGGEPAPGSVVLKATGLGPLAYANWAIPLFSALNGLMLAGIAMTITGSRRATALAALLFVCANWIGQTYMSPQAFAFVLYLGAMGMILAKFGRPHASRRVALLAWPLDSPPVDVCEASSRGRLTGRPWGQPLAVRLAGRPRSLPPIS